MEQAQARIETRRDRWPLIDIVWCGAVDLAAFKTEFGRWLDLCREAHSLGQKLAFLADLSAFDPLNSSAVTRKAVAELNNQHANKLAQAVVAEARVISNPLVRGAVTATIWLSKAPWEIRTFATLRDGEAWLRECLRSA